MLCCDPTNQALDGAKVAANLIGTSSGEVEEPEPDFFLLTEVAVPMV